MGRLKCSDITLERPYKGLGDVSDWVNNAFNSKPEPKSVTVVRTDNKRIATWRFTDCVPTGLKLNFGKWPTTPKEMQALSYELTFSTTSGTFAQPDSFETKPPNNNPHPSTGGPYLRMGVPGANLIPLVVQHSSPIVIRRIARLGEEERSMWHVDDFELKMLKKDAAPFIAWYESFVLKGDTSPENERIYGVSFKDDAGNPLVDVNLRVGIIGVRDASNKFKEIKDIGENDMVVVKLYGRKDKNQTDIIIRKI
jgi:hypothetical protein